ncbi:hypothetical protein N7510_001951 [Penicillium lagena]|uniref:uncharacterized protein n=1 Tax=Penicillium lagena TaxID=94218 RepID=UPI0025422EEB|nr:uncharacterized protein N7510_001951 [Penicillium lagena]KAJ5625642.1 hypothetical protein N7510_001951 [Penicillium lagena]
MASRDLDQDIAPIPRSREENQERAFIAASRRKDRSLDARLESANRASMLHKKRTGKAFHITKEIVEKEAMYEEVDERYQEKRIRMLQAQNMQIEEQFHRHLLAAFAARANGSGSQGSSIASRRASLAPRASTDSGSRKLSLDLSNLPTAFPHGMDSAPFSTGDGYVLSPSASNFDPSPESSYMACSEASYPNMMASSSAAATPAYMGQQTPWNSQVPPSWPTLPQQQQQQQQIPTPGPTPTDNQAVQMWQQQMMQQAQMPADAAQAIQMRQFRDRLASAPELPMQQPQQHHLSAPPMVVSESVSHGHSRGKSQPNNNFRNLHLLTQGTNIAAARSRASSPKVESFTAETKSTPDFCPTPNTPLSPTAVATQEPVKQEGDGIMVSHEELDPDFNEFSQFALDLGNSSHPHLGEREPFGFDEFVALDDFATVSC